ncbi:MAG: hypothetical protein RBR52_03430 [Thiomonas sp.]|uniref:hypothetical protein n=1 Tax=Thiomonas sp. TaxID=2047785 RepID=UPI002A370CEF|nr:hypothetical protein [Thiomonas sp.]MDY0329533.1 hypothetical protein [Thiomonas sp.]
MKHSMANLVLASMGTALLASCGGGSGTPTTTYNQAIPQPSLPGTVVQVLQNSATTGLTAIPVNSDGSYDIDDTTPVIITAQTTQGLGQSLLWGFSAIDGSGLSYSALSSGGFKVAGSTDPLLQQVGFSGLAAVPPAISNPTGSTPLQFSSLIAPGGSLILGLSQDLNLASGPFQQNVVFRVLSAYAGNWKVDYGSGGASSSYSGTCTVNVSDSGVVSGSCDDKILGNYDVTGRDYGSGNALGVQFQGKNGIVNFFLGTSPVTLNQLQGKTNMFVTYSSSSSSTAGSGTTSGTTTTQEMTSVFAQDPVACDLIPGATFVQIANPQTCASSNQILFSNSATGTTTGSTSTSGSASNGSPLPVTWTATKMS